MITKQKILILLSFLGLIFSTTFGIKFTLTPNFEYVDYWVKIIPLPLFDYASESNETFLQSSIIGYIIFLFICILLHWECRFDNQIRPFLGIFLIVSLSAILFEINSLFLFLDSQYNGQTLTIGPILFIVSYLIIKSYPRRNELKKYAL